MRCILYPCPQPLKLLVPEVSSALCLAAPSCRVSCHLEAGLPSRLEYWGPSSDRYVEAGTFGVFHFLCLTISAILELFFSVFSSGSGPDVVGKIRGRTQGILLAATTREAMGE